MPDNFLPMLWGFAAGLTCGALYFGGLWLTVKHLSGSNRPYRLLVLSFILRMTIVLAVFYQLLSLGWGVLCVAMFGLLLARQLWLLSKSGGKEKEWRSALMQPFSGNGQ